MLRQLRYFQAIVRNNSFSEAAEECHISQSAISQQMMSLEQTLGFQLLERKGRKFALTPAGAYFYKKSLVLAADYEQLCIESAKIARGDDAVLKIGHLRSNSGKAFSLALEEFSTKYPQVSLQLLGGNHEELYTFLRNETADLVLNDQRRAFSNEYVNLILSRKALCIELSSRNAMASLSSVTARELKNIPCILIASKEQREAEREYYQTVIGFQGDYLYAENLEEARLLIVTGQGFLPADDNQMTAPGDSICRIPLYRGDVPVTRTYCLFWKKENSGYYVEEFARILKNKFTSDLY